MENEIYHFNRPKKQKDYKYFNLGNEELGLADYINDKKSPDENKIISAYCNDLKKILENDDLFKMINSIFSIEKNLDKLKLKFNLMETSSLPSLSRLYEKIAPLLLKTLSFGVDINQFNQEELIHGWLETIRVSVEEELISRK